MFDPTEYVKAASAAKLLKVSVPRIHQLRASRELPALATDAGHLFRVSDCLKLRRERERRRALPTRRGARG
jgi:hypothetical protein